MSEALHYRKFDARDIEAGAALVAQSGWNQTADDWRVFLDLGEVIAVQSAAGRVIATAATLPHGPQFGWISMVLVDTAFRRRGIATRLLRECIERLQRSDRIPVLDATPAGREVYVQLGFRDGWGITRWQTESGDATAMPVSDAGVEVRQVEPDDWAAIASLDLRAFGADRSALLRRLHARSRGFACVAIAGGALSGFVLGRDGSRATYIGPIVATDARIALALIRRAVGSMPGPAFIDTLDAHAALGAWLAQAGFTVQRPYTRMALGAACAFGDESLMWSIAGPELG